MKKISSIMCGVIALSLCSSLQALPEICKVAQGKIQSVEKHKSQRTLTLATQNGTIINWESFSINPGETVEFLQQDAASSVLNRVYGGIKSEIHGLLKSNGQVFLINPSGILIGAEGRIDTAGLIASTLDLSDQEFLQGSYLNFDGSSEERVINLGRIETKEGDLFLIARFVENKGEVHSSQRAYLLAGNGAHIGKNGGMVRLSEDLSSVENEGFIEALRIGLEGGSTYQYAVKNSGQLVATETKERGGHIYLEAEQGGVAHNGKMFAPSGKIEILGREVTLGSGSQTDVSGSAGGGAIQIGFQEEKTLKTHIEENSKIFADASGVGNGGQVLIFSQSETLVFGDVSARGRGEGSQGGLVEISSQEKISWSGDVNLKGERGDGHLFFDPKNILIVSSGTDAPSGNTFSSNPSLTVSISGSAISAALNSANLTLQANTDIQINDNIMSTGANTLTLAAGRSITMGTKTIELNGGAFIATINDAGANPSYRDAGSAQFSMSRTSRINTHGGNISITAGNFGGTTQGAINSSQGSIDAGGGNITLTGVGASGGVKLCGISLTNAPVITSGSGTITLNGTGGNGTDNNCGVYLTGVKTQVKTVSGTLSISGSGLGTGETNQGVRLESGAAVISQGNISMSGYGATGTDNNCGVFLTDGASIRSLNNGPLSITSVGHGSGNNNHGLSLENGSFIESSGSVSNMNTFYVAGTGSNGNVNNCGINLVGSGTRIATVATNLNMVGVSLGSASGQGNQGLVIGGEALITSTGVATVSLTGTGGSGLNYNNGVSLTGPSSQLKSVTGAITVVGNGNGTGDSNQGVAIGSGSSIASLGTGVSAADILVTGTGSSTGLSYNNGVSVNGIGTLITSVDGDIVVTGTGHGSGIDNQGVVKASGGDIVSTGTGSVTIDSNPPMED